MTSRIEEVEAPAAMVRIDLAFALLLGIGPDDAHLPGLAEDTVKGVVIHEEGVVLHLDVIDGRLSELQEDAVIQRNDGKRSPGGGFRQAEQAGEERGGFEPVLRGDDGVIERYGRGKTSNWIAMPPLLEQGVIEARPGSTFIPYRPRFGAWGSSHPRVARGSHARPNRQAKLGGAAQVVSLS